MPDENAKENAKEHVKNFWIGVFVFVFGCALVTYVDFFIVQVAGMLGGMGGFLLALGSLFLIVVQASKD